FWNGFALLLGYSFVSLPCIACEFSFIPSLQCKALVSAFLFVLCLVSLL
ncbi:putative membrane protein, partial [Chlamydia psittaci 84-8471/1]